MSDCTDAQPHPGDITPKEAKAGILPSHGISLDVPGLDGTGRPPVLRHLSSPAYQSPLRHHRRTPSQRRQVKETLNAHSEYTNSEDDGRYQHRINQYIIKEEIGRGSFGAVHLAIDQYGNEYAVKEFSKSRLRKRAQSNILRRPHNAVRRPGQLAAGISFNFPLHRHSSSDVRQDCDSNPLYLIKEEIAIMKKLDHPNLVSLIEVLDDPEEDSLYMVLEMCKKGVIMRVGIDSRADPYDSESCRFWFRDMILGIEYLHAQGVVHRDIKPDNLLLTEDDVLKIVDFGVSEMFEKQSEMLTAKSAGSPAFLPPELCVAKHGDISGKAADIWSMGVSLYCLRYGRIPFEKEQMLELYEAIKNDEPDCQPVEDQTFIDLIHKVLEKDPKKRITMNELREHPWVTNNGTDPLLSKEENVNTLVELPSKVEVNHAITVKFKNLMTVMKAVGKFKNLLFKRRPELLKRQLGDEVRIVQPLQEESKQTEANHEASDSPPDFGGQGHALQKSRSVDLDDRRAVDGALSAEGIHHDINASIPDIRTISDRMDTSITTKPAGARSADSPDGSARRREAHESDIQTNSTRSRGVRNRPHSQGTDGKGQAHDPMDHEVLWLGIGSGEADLLQPSIEIVAESPSAAEFGIYDKAYHDEVQRIREAQGHEATVYLTRRVDSKREYRTDQHMIQEPKQDEVAGRAHAGWKGVLDAARAADKEEPKPDTEKESLGQNLANIAARIREDAKAVGENVKTVGDHALGKSQQLDDDGGSAVADVWSKVVDGVGGEARAQAPSEGVEQRLQ